MAVTPLKMGLWGLFSRFVAILAGGQGRPLAIALLIVITAICVPFALRDRSPENLFVFDTYQRLFPRKADPRFPVKIVDIDEKSLATLGRWPWPRTRMALLAEAASRLGAMAVGFDIIMPEPDTLSPDIILANRPDVSPHVRDELAKLPSNDSLLAQVLRRTPSVVARAALRGSAQEKQAESRQTPVLIVGESPVKRLTPRYPKHLTNIPEIEEAAFGCGYLNDTRDQDGVVRSVPLLLNVGGKLAPALAVELLRTALGMNWYTVHGTGEGVKGIQVGESFVPTDPDGRIRLYFSPGYQGRRVSALSVLNGELSPHFFAKTIAIVGGSGVGTIDITATPVADRMDGLEIQAQVVENILAGSRLIRPQKAFWLELAVLLMTAALSIAFLPRLGPAYSLVSWLAGAALLCAIGVFLFAKFNTLYDPSLPIAGNALFLLVLQAAGFAASNRKRRELDAALEEERLERMRLAGELQAAREIQMGMLPEPESIEGLPANLEFYALLEPAEEVGGDLYDAFMMDERHFFFLVADVAGKGVAASLFMALSKTLCKSTALRDHAPLNALMETLNHEISRENKPRLFVTAMAGVLDVTTGELQLCGAGHEAPIRLRPGEGPRPLEIDGGPPLCALEGFRYTAAHEVLESGDMLVLISDGVTEAQNSAQGFYGRKGIIEYLNTLRPPDLHAESVCRGLYGDVKRFAQGARQSDDITILVVRFNGVTPSLGTV